MSQGLSLEHLLEDEEVYNFLRIRFGDKIPTRPSDKVPVTPSSEPTPSEASSRPSSEMETSGSEDNSSSESSVETDYTVVSSRKRSRKGKKGPSKAPKITDSQTSAVEKTVEPPKVSTRPTTSGTIPEGGRKAPAPPPLYIQDKSKWTAVSSWCNELHINFKSARSTPQGIKVDVPSSKDHRALSKVLRERNIAFHTYTLPEDRLLRVVIRNIPKEVSCGEVKESSVTSYFTSCTDTKYIVWSVAVSASHTIS